MLCVPPGPDGRVDDATLAAAAVAGVDEVYRVGGAQAIAAMAYGTGASPAVDVIVGPGQPLRGRGQAPGVRAWSAWPRPSPAPPRSSSSPGPDTPAEFAAIDLVVQAEHGPDGLAWLVTWSEELADAVDRRGGPHRGRLAPAGRPRGHAGVPAGAPCLVDGPEQALAVANVVAPEHLELMLTERRRVAARPACDSAGAVFLGPTVAGQRRATTWPGPTTSCPPTGRPASPAPCGSTTSASTSTPCSVDDEAAARPSVPTS